MSKIRFPVAVTSEDHAQQLEQRESAHGTPQQVALRCRILLGAIDGQKNQAIANRLNVSRPTVNLWRKRARDLGIGQVWEIAPGRGRKAHYDQACRDAIINATRRREGVRPAYCSILWNQMIFKTKSDNTGDWYLFRKRGIPDFSHAGGLRFQHLGAEARCGGLSGGGFQPRGLRFFVFGPLQSALNGVDCAFELGVPDCSIGSGGIFALAA